MTALIIFGTGLALILPRLASAHCPFCTAGAGLAAVLAVSLGVSPATVGMFVGAFSIAIGLWISKLIKKQYVQFQAPILAVVSFLLTIFPMLPVMDSGYFPVYIGWWGQYGTTLGLNMFLTGSLVGAVLMFVSPSLSRLVSRMTGGRRWPYQGLSLTFGALVLGAVILQFVL